jgi:hypothetical protein
MSGTATRLCEVRSGTESPCLRPAAVEIRGVPFCERCAREQEAYFAIGELTQALTLDRTGHSQSSRCNEPLVGRLLEMRRGNRVARAVKKERAKAAIDNL